MDIHYQPPEDNINPLEKYTVNLTQKAKIIVNFKQLIDKFQYSK